MGRLAARNEELSQESLAHVKSVERQQKLLATDHDIREILGARSLHIIGAFDASSRGEFERPFGRIFYTEGKSLIFLCIPPRPTERMKRGAVFQAWGEAREFPNYLSTGIFRTFPHRSGRREHGMNLCRRIFRNCNIFLRLLESLLLKLALVAFLAMGLIYGVQEGAAHLWSTTAARSKPLSTEVKEVHKHTHANSLCRQRVTRLAGPSSCTCQGKPTFRLPKTKAKGKCDTRAHNVTSQKSQ